MSRSNSLSVRQWWASLRPSTASVGSNIYLLVHSLAVRTLLDCGRLRTLCYSCAATLLPIIALFGVVEAGFQLSNAIHLKSPISPYANVGSIVYDPDLLYRPRNLPVLAAKEGRLRVIALGDSLIGGRRGTT